MQRKFFYWSLIEVILVFFLPFILDRKFGVRRSVKYFIIQIFGSFIYLFFSLLDLPGCGVVTFLSLCLKLGVAPIHYWVLSVVRGMPWSTMYILFSFTKVVPLFIFMNIPIFKETIFFILISFFVGNYGGVGASSLRVVIRYSSIRTSS